MLDVYSCNQSKLRNKLALTSKQNVVPHTGRLEVCRLMNALSRDNAALSAYSSQHFSCPPLHMPLTRNAAPRLQVPPPLLCLSVRSTAVQGKAWRFTCLTTRCSPRHGLPAFPGASWRRVEAQLVTDWAGFQARLTAKSEKSARQNLKWLARAQRASRTAQDEVAGLRVYCLHNDGWVGKALQ